MEEAQALEEELNQLERPSGPRSPEAVRSEQEKREYSYKRKVIRQTVRKKEGKLYIPLYI